MKNTSLKLNTAPTITRRHGGAFKTRRSQGGIALVSYLLAGLLGAIAIGFMVQQYNTGVRQERINKGTNDVTLIASALKSTYGVTNQYANLTTAIAVRGRVIPEYLRVGTTDTAQNGYDGAITVAPITITSANDGVALGSAGVLTEDCQDLVLKSEKNARGMTVAGTVVKADDGILNLASLSTACESAPKVDLVYRVGKN